MGTTKLTLGGLFRHHRNAAVLKQKELATLMHCHYSMISRIETDDQKPTLDFAKRFAQVLHLEKDQQQELINAILRQSNMQPMSELPLSEQRADWGEAPDVSNFQGRQTELVKVEQWIVAERCRLVGIFGMGGIGKTTFATKVATQTKNQFKYIIWYSLRNAPSLETVLNKFIHFLSDHREGDIPDALDNRLSLLLGYLQENRCLLVLDNFETIFDTGERTGRYRSGYEGYSDFIRLIGEVPHQSCLLLTSREKHREFALLEGDLSPVHSLILDGLSLDAGQEILKDKGLYGSSEAWTTLIERYSGNPLALKLAAETIRELLEGDIAEFLNERIPIFDSVRELLENQFNRLSKLERDIMHWLAIARESVSVEYLQDNVIHLESKPALLNGLNALRRRSLIEPGVTGFTMPNVIMEYTTDRIVDQICNEINTGIIARFNSHALIQAQTKEYVRESQTQLILKVILDRLLTTLSRDEIEDKLRNILTGLQELRQPKRGYAAGNALNLLIYLKSNLTGWNFSHLKVCQAYLQGAELHNVDFTHAEFEKTIFTDTFGNILSIVFSPDKKNLIAGTADGSIRVWRVLDSMQILMCKGHTNRVWSVDISPNGKIIASGSDDQTVQLWDAETGTLTVSLRGHNGLIRSVSFNSSGQFLASSSEDQTIRVWDASTAQCLKVLHGHIGLIWSLDFHPTSNILTSGGDDQLIRIWDIETGQCVNTLQGHSGAVRSVAYNLTGNIIASAGNDQTIRLWDASTAQCLKVLRGHTSWIRSVAFSPDGNMLASGSDDHTVRLWDIAKGETIKILRGHTNQVTAVVFNRDGNLLASGSDDQTVKLWDARGDQCVTTFQGYANGVRTLSFDSHHHIIASGNQDKSVRLWNIETGQCTNTLRGNINGIRSVAFSPDGNMLGSVDI